MKEQLYTIPLNEAVDANDECPFCFVERAIEQDLMDFCLGSGSSYMEADIREMTDLGVSVETGEMRNKKAIEQYFSYTQKNVNMSRKSVKAASDYYKNMSRVNYIDPQLLDQKK